jgi:flagellar protein FlgJ
MTAAITDFSQFSSLRSGANQNDPAVLREVASQFEALFIETMLKNMRAGELAEPVFGQSDQHKMYQEMMDQQLALNMADGRGIGLGEMLVRQLGGESERSAPTAERFSLPATSDRQARASTQWSGPEEFVRALWPHAKRVAQRLNVATEGIVAQAALETGWGAHVMQRSNGASSNNLFGIKAGNDWSGGSVVRPTVEYVNGVAERKLERFRAYPDIISTFNDYAKLIEEHPRYSDVRGAGSDSRSFAWALQQAGYATDPLYAAKIARILASETMQTAVTGLKTP